ncbi:hypothetical protein KUCAC02_031079 [Chaenocephalus aceratus]|uniref:Uncharacterized protein n=1 Tax=Chaenocephalus aceratus TaxID=36190 RepID=A0ACB9XLU7_CHAAC|nr:hypothetical protein KUCAC02_031079 [Chaenocephalus aceratus]
MPGSLSNEDEGQDDMDFEDDMPDDDDEGERNTVPLTPLDSFFSDSDSLKQQKKQKPKKMKEGKMPKVKKRKKEVCFLLLRCLCNLNERQRTVSGSEEAGSSVTVTASVSLGHQGTLWSGDSVPVVSV